MNHKEKLFETACDKLSQAGISFKVANGSTFHVKSGKWNFYAGTGTITRDGSRALRGNGIIKFINLVQNSKKERASKYTSNGRIRLLVRK